MADNEIIEELEETLEEAEEVVARKEITIDLKVDEKKTQEAMKDLEEAFGSIRKRIESINSNIGKAMGGLTADVKAHCSAMGKELRKAFTVTNTEEYEMAAARFGEGLAKSLLAINEGMSAIETSIVNAVAPMAAAVASAMNEIVPTVTSFISGLSQTITDATTTLQPLATWLLDSFLVPLAEWTGGVVTETIQLLVNALGSVSAWISENQMLIQVMTGVITAFTAAWAVTDLVFFVDKLGGVSTILRGITTAINQCTLAKLASKAEDMAIIALYAGDFVKAMVQKIAQLAASTAAWIANTAAKVASTTAEWAQIAATTVWNGICATATAVTSAFGAAMAAADQSHYARGRCGGGIDRYCSAVGEELGYGEGGGGQHLEYHRICIWQSRSLVSIYGFGSIG